MSKTHIINGKPLKLCATAAWDEAYRGMEGAYYVTLAINALNKKGVDMLVFENVKENGVLKMQIRCAGYDLETDSVLDETTVFFKAESLEIQTFWLKLDNYGDHYVGTLLFPSDY